MCEITGMGPNLKFCRAAGGRPEASIVIELNFAEPAEKMVLGEQKQYTLYRVLYFY